MELTVQVGFEELLSLIKKLPAEQKTIVKSVLEAIETDGDTAPVNSERPLGTMKGLVVYMSDDFDEPLDDFKDYM
ncbi:hypothetical protein GCM10028803_59030 [Larkinella knui]|uniref:DUF2281 domain-containing protein n=1 Tax=Larkinella knui TaxID=2025310 RepID=A0A3P1CAC7_9BACT|nr:DUF2281 domain-containing protein [Larkinella knui]RRB10259.1 DUF2281 domain-containing protein [Larkinella knui]